MMRQAGPLVSPLAGAGAAQEYAVLGQQPKEGFSCRSCCFVCLGIAGTLVVFLLFLLLRVATASCTLDSFDCRLALPENAKAAGAGEMFQVATTENTQLDGLDLNVLGVWWMDGNPLTAEQLVSFAGSSGVPPFPAEVSVPFSGARRWTWADSFVGRIVIFYYAMTERADVVNQFDFFNKSYAEIKPVADVISGVFGFKAMNANEWDRVDTYILRRIVHANGTAGPFWDKFVDWYTDLYPNGRVLVQKSDSTCLRRCQYFSPCALCSAIC